MAKKLSRDSLPLRAAAPLRENRKSRGDAETQREGMDEELPEGWCFSPLGGVLEMKYGKGLVKDRRRPGSVPVYGSNGVVGEHDESVTSGPTIIVGRKGSVGKVHLCPAACWPIDTTYFFEDFGPFDSTFLLHQLRSLRLGELDQSTAIPGLSRKQAYEANLLVAPLAEQRRIVAKVEELLGRVNAARARLAKVPAILKRFRQSVLAAACSGELTAEWREEHQDIPPACQLLDDIKSDVLSQLDKKRDLARYEEMFERSPPLAPNEGLPENWMLCRVGHIGFVCNGSTPSRKCPEFWRGQISWVSSGEVQNNVIRETRERITKDGFSNSSLRLLPVGTVLIAMIGEGRTRGQSAILDTEATINQNIAAVDLRHGRVTSRYLWHWFRFQYFLTRESGSGSGPQALNCQRVRELQFVLPPLAEQFEIVRRVDALFALADKIEARVATATARVEKITQAVLAKAFRGELVPTEAELARQERRDYEPASVLLERIRTEREAADNDKPRRKSPRRKAKKVPKRK